MENIKEYEVGEVFKIPTLVEDLGMLFPTEKSKQKARYGIFECPFCGTHFKAQTNSIKNELTKSCGCYNRSQTSKRITTHGGRGTRLYGIWVGIKKRTLNPKNKDYKDYIGRGITICEEWKQFVPFRDWALSNDYSDELSIDRINNDGNYEPTNCRWTTRAIQSRNQRMPCNNTLGFKGVSYNKKAGKFQGYITIDKKLIYLGYFVTAIEGAIAYNNYIIENNLEGFILNTIPSETENI